MLQFVQGNTAPDIKATIHALGAPDEAIDLTGCTVHFQMRKEDDRRFTVNNEAEVLDEEGGQVRYRWGPNDLAVPGDYEIQWLVTYADDRAQTTSESETIRVRRR